jgi:predicted phosphodiesterase
MTRTGGARYGMISDVHGNLHALEAVLAALGRAGVEQFICSGDVVGYGPFPNECVRRVAALPGFFVAGNHDLMAIGRLPTTGVPEIVRATQEWTQAALAPDVRRTLEQLPQLAVADSIVVTHAALGSTNEYVRTQEQAAVQLVALRAGWPRADLLVLGHTHRQWLFGERRGTIPGMAAIVADDGPYLLNPGSVGQSRQFELAPRARYAILDLAQRRVEFHAIDYDRGAARQALRERNLPLKAIYLRPALPQVARRSIGALVARAARWTGQR